MRWRGGGPVKRDVLNWGGVDSGSYSSIAGSIGFDLASYAAGNEQLREGLQAEFVTIKIGDGTSRRNVCAAQPGLADHDCPRASLSACSRAGLASFVRSSFHHHFAGKGQQQASLLRYQIHRGRGRCPASALWAASIRVVSRQPSLAIYLRLQPRRLMSGCWRRATQINPERRTERRRVASPSIDGASTGVKGSGSGSGFDARALLFQKRAKPAPLHPSSCPAPPTPGGVSHLITAAICQRTPALCSKSRLRLRQHILITTLPWTRRAVSVSKDISPSRTR